MYEVRSVPFAGPVSSLPFCSAEAAMCLVSLSRTCWARVGYTACGQATTAEGWLASQGDGHERIRVGTLAARRVSVDSQSLIKSRLRRVRTKVVEYEIARMLAVRRTL